MRQGYRASAACDVEASSADGRKRVSEDGVVPVCDCRRRIRVSSGVAALGPILCGICDTEFSADTVKELHREGATPNVCATYSIGTFELPAD